MAKKKITKPKNRNFGKEIGAISQQASAYADAMAASQAKLNAGLLDQNFAATERIAGRLNNGYTTAARAQLDRSMGQIGGMEADASRVQQLGEIASSDVQGTEIERRLQERALEELRLGGMLTPEEERAVEQGTRVAWADRGMAMGRPAAIGEVLNRAGAVTARGRERAGFAGNVNQMLSGNRIARLGTAGNLIGQTAGIRQNAAALGMQGAQGYVALDPFQRALGSNLPLATSQASAGLTSGAYGQLLGYASDLNNTNFNANWTDYLGKLNRMYAKQSAPQASGGGASGMLTGAATGALSGAAAGTALGPWGTAGGAVVGGVLGMIGNS